MSSTPEASGQQRGGGQETSGLARVRTAAVMRSTAEQLRLAAQLLHSRAAASRSARTAMRLRALSAAVSAQADDIQQRADRLTGDMPASWPNGGR
jgi:hypothetical protein